MSTAAAAVRASTAAAGDLVNMVVNDPNEGEGSSSDTGLQLSLFCHTTNVNRQ